ncbi:MAG: PqqD family protein [Oscillospiraceae bacterium]|nr:PqqD family protein [Oscillospiraceae bacterium]
MKINENFVLREVAGSWVVIPIGEKSVDFNGMMNLNETGVLLWRELEKGAKKEELVSALTAEYDVSAEIAAKDIDEFVETLEKAGCLEA